MPWPPLVNPPGFEQDVVRRVTDESGGDVTAAEATGFLYRVPGFSTVGGRGYTDLIGGSVDYTVPLRIPHIFKDAIKGEETVLCRAFVGTEDAGDVMPFDDMEEHEDGAKVWVFPRAGVRYHAEDCRYIKNDPCEVLLSNSVRRKYAPCELCEPGGARDGTLVYVFPHSGEAYHLASCTKVDKYVIALSEKDAREQGYTACSVCGGGGKGGEGGEGE